MPITTEDKPPPYTPSPNLVSTYGYNPNDSGFVPPPPPPGFQSYPVQTAPVSVPPGIQHFQVPTNPVPNYGATTTVLIPNDIIIVGGCPACRVGVLEDDFTCLGIFCAIFFFPLGILCCLALKNKRCSNCGAYFG